MNLFRVTVEGPAYAYCTRADLGCMWTDSGTGFPHSEADAHVLMSGHEVRVHMQRDAIIRPSFAEAVAS